MTSAISHRACVLFATILLATTAFAQTTFTFQAYDDPNKPSDVFVADLNGDGKDDIVTVQELSNMVTVFLNHGDGIFTADGSAQYLAGANPQHVVVADINGDGKLDIVTQGGNCFQGNPSVVNLLLGNGDGTFQPPLETQLPPNECGSSLGLTKVNSAKWDLAVATFQNNIRLLMNNGAGPFTLGAAIPGPGFSVSALSSADYNRDGHWDIAATVTTSADGFTVWMFQNDGLGNYTPKQLFTAAQATGAASMQFDGPYTVDVNGDGFADLLVPFLPSSVPTTLQGGVVVAVNNGAGSFTRTALRMNSRFRSVSKPAEGDLTGDGLHDIVLPAASDPNLGPDAFVFFRATSKTTWAGAQYLSIGSANPVATAIGKFTAGFGFAGTSLDNVLRVYETGSATPPGVCVAPATAGIHVCSPAANATVSSQVSMSAAANGGTKPVTAMKAYIDGKQVAATPGGVLNASIPTAVGTHTLNVNAWNSAGTVFTFQSKFTVH